MKVHDLTFDQLNAAISYDPLTGALTWKIDSGKSIKAGMAAGAWKSLRIKTTGAEKKYLYVTYLGRNMVASRVAWMLHYQEWPENSIQFIDGDTSNLKISNLKQAMFKSGSTTVEGRKLHRMSKEAARHYGLKRHYGITLTEYTEMYNAQDGKCAICGRPERSMLHGKIRDLSVDHCHATGKIRQLLCNACNHILGESEENREILLSAIAYIDKHKDKELTENSNT